MSEGYSIVTDPEEIFQIWVLSTARSIVVMGRGGIEDRPHLRESLRKECLQWGWDPDATLERFEREVLLKVLRW